eukprot:549493-Alexandrium_andersonii.AAC.1
MLGRLQKTRWCGAVRPGNAARGSCKERSNAQVGAHAGSTQGHMSGRMQGTLGHVVGHMLGR